MPKDKFSLRYGFERMDSEIKIRHEAPGELRSVIVDIAYEADSDPHSLRGIVCKVLRAKEDPSNWSAFPNVDSEVRDHLESCEWYEVYDIIEAIHSSLKSKDKRERWEKKQSRADYFSDELNKYFLKRGIGWRLTEETLEVRGPESFESVVVTAREVLRESGRDTAEKELHEALQDRPGGLNRI